MEWMRRGTGDSGTVALFPGAWNPPTRAHVAIARAALSHAGEVVFVLPRAFPHKPFAGPGLERRLRWLESLAALDPRFSVAVSEDGLFIGIAREFRALDPRKRVLLLCGGDAAERIVNWRYDEPDTIAAQLKEYELLVAPRPVDYAPPPELSARVHPLTLDERFRWISSTEARDRIRKGEDARGLLPPEIWDDVIRCYRP